MRDCELALWVAAVVVLSFAFTAAGWLPGPQLCALLQCGSAADGGWFAVQFVTVILGIIAGLLLAVVRVER